MAAARCEWCRYYRMGFPSVTVIQPHERKGRLMRCELGYSMVIGQWHECPDYEREPGADDDREH